MRSLAFTFILALLAALACAVAAWQWSQGNFDALFGAPPKPVGAPLYDTFSADQVKHIRITTRSNNATFSLLENGWRATSPWNDRMDPRAASAIIHFTLGMRVEDLAAAEKIQTTQSGLGEESVNIRLEDADHRPLANFKLGRVTPWKAEIKGNDQPVPTVFIQPRDKNRKGHVYSCTGDINSLFKDDLKFLRDHRPLYFNPLTLRKIAIRSPQGELTLGRETPQAPWRIVQPLDLPTHPAAMKELLEGLFELQAVKVSERASAAPAATEDTTKNIRLALESFLPGPETVLEIHPPASADEHETTATVSDRPEVVFSLPLKPEPELVAISDLPLTVNDLRDPTLTHLSVPSLRGITIQSATGADILISREPPKPWMATIRGTTMEANEENLYALLQAVTTSKAIGFESDAATDFSQWGLDRPIITLRFLGADNQVLELRFSNDTRGNYFVNRLGTPTVMRVDPAVINAIAVRPHEWRHARLWSLDRVNLLAIRRHEADQPPIVLKYRFIDETWQAETEGKDLTPKLDTQRTNFMLSVLEGLKVSRWLAPGDEAAGRALEKPTFTLTVTELLTDRDDEPSGVRDRTVRFAPATAAGYPGHYFGRLDEDPNAFLLERETFDKISGNILEN